MNLRRIQFGLLTAAFVWLVVEGLCFTTLILLKTFKNIDVPVTTRFELNRVPKSRIKRIIAKQESYYPFSPTLGWTVKPNGRTKDYRANSQGIRSNSEYSLAPDPGTLRIAAFGDSFVHGTEVKNGDTWPDRLGLERGVEVLNFGVGAYGLDQAFLRYAQDGTRFNADIVFIGFMTENIHRNVNNFRPFYTPTMFEPRSKPRFELVDGELKLLPNPLATRDAYRELLSDEEAVIERLGKKDFYYQTRYRDHPLFFLPSTGIAIIFRNHSSYRRTIKNRVYNVDSEAFELTTHIFEAFAARALAEGSLPVVIMFPDRRDIQRRERHGTKQYQPMLDYLDRAEFIYLDLMTCFAEMPTPYEVGYMPQGHYDPATNQIVANCIHRFLSSKNLLTRPSVEKALEEAQENPLRETSRTWLK